MKKKLVLKPFVIPTLYTAFAIIILVSLFFSVEIEKDKQSITYVSKIILDNYVPVINTEDTIVKPYTSDKVSTSNNFYDYKGTDEDQTKSIILYENTYMQNTGINYTANEAFDVVSILSGEVIEVKEKELLSKTVTIKHSNDIISVYQSLSDVKVKVGDKVNTGQVIGKSGSCDLIKDSENNLHFELYINGNIVNPNEFFDKKIGEI